MSADFRALCAELLMALENAISIIYCEDGTKHISTAKPIVNRARAALADEPAVPQGREPASADLEKEFRYWWKETYGSPYFGAVPLVAVLLWTECVLAHWGNPAPTPPADGEVAELVAWLRETGDTIQPSHLAEHQRYKRAAELLERQVVVPVAVSVRLPGPEDCDAEGRCWWFAPETEVDFGGWTFGTTEICANSQWVDWENTHWLPAHALPLPEVGE